MPLNLEKIVNNSRSAFEEKADPVKKNRVLKKFANLLLRNKKKIFKENYKDIKFTYNLIVLVVVY